MGCAVDLVPADNVVNLIIAAAFFTA